MSELSSNRYEPIAVSDESTVVAEFVPEPQAAERYQSEAELERAFVKQLEQQAYEVLPITSDAELIANLRTQLERLNRITFSEGEWKQFLTEVIARSGDGIVEKTARIQEEHVQVLRRDDDTTKNVMLIDKANIHNNALQVVNQVVNDIQVDGARRTRYDVTILVNGLPLVHVELKRRGVDIREAFNQIDRYQRDSFWAGSGLFEYVQLFVISNGTLTKYYSNTTRDRHVRAAHGGRRTKRQTSNSFEFTSWWADAKNGRIADLSGFTKTFFAKHALLNVLTKYCVFDADRQLLVMRPYQIVATERIVERVNIASNDPKRLGTSAAGGYVWHTTGSGKTLTSFKAAQLATGIPGVSKVLFVVDRKDLDYQTMKEYDRFQKGAANGSSSTQELQSKLADPDARIIVTTIQKLARFIAQNRQHEIYGGRIVIIFDECHRSQFGDMHKAITKAFRQYHLFGFTGTPIFTENATRTGAVMHTTAETFGDRLHTYTVVNAIADDNVLPFRIDYNDTVRAREGIQDKSVSGIDTERALLAPARVDSIVNYVLDNFDTKTKRARSYQHGERRLSGFNSIFATASIDAAKAYYTAFERIQRDREVDPAYRRLRIGIIYSFDANEAVDDDELFDAEVVDDSRVGQSSRDFLSDAIMDYNDMFATSFSTDLDGFQNYYKDLSQRMKQRELDIVIVVNMFLTGFDATTLNTLWVDKNLHSHGLIQAYSRTNRILNSVKTFGQIVAFRDLEQATKDALALFGNKDAVELAILKPYADYFADYEDALAALASQFVLGESIVGEANEQEFVRLFGAILRLRNILTSFDDFTGQDPLSARDLQDYTSIYLDLYAKYRGHEDAEKEQIADDLVFEVELVKQVEVNVDYILMLVRDYLGQGAAADMGQAREGIRRAVESSPSLRNKRDLIEAFVDSLSVDADVDKRWRAFVAGQRDAELARIVAEAGLDPVKTEAFIAGAFRDGSVPSTGTAVAAILPPMSKFSTGNGYGATKQSVLDRLQAFFDRFYDLG